MGASPWTAAWVPGNPDESAGVVGGLSPPPWRRIRVTAQDEYFLRSPGAFPGAAGHVADNARRSQLGGLTREGLLYDSLFRSLAGVTREICVTNFLFSY